jgi:hypothetical protein
MASTTVWVSGVDLMRGKDWPGLGWSSKLISRDSGLTGGVARNAAHCKLDDQVRDNSKSGISRMSYK